MSQTRACIFDLDGVIVDTAIYHYQAWKRLANQLGFDFTEEDNEKLKGISRKGSLDLILSWGGVIKTEEEREDLARLKNSWYVEMISGMTPQEILPGTVEFLRSLKGNGYKIALGSASKNAGIILDKVELTSYFDAIVDGNTVTASKPDPQVFLKGAELLDTPPGQCVVFEDAMAGIEAAKAAGMKVIAIGKPETLHNADLVIEGLHEMNLQLFTKL